MRKRQQVIQIVGLLWLSIGIIGPAMANDRVLDKQLFLPSLTRSVLVAPSPYILWSANHEKANLAEWRLNQGETVFNTETPPGSSIAFVTDQVARSGNYSLKLKITGAKDGQVQAARVFRRWINLAEDQPLPDEAYYSAWYYFPESYVPERNWNIFQFKSKGIESEPMFSFNIGNLSSGDMYLYVWDRANGNVLHDQTINPQPIAVREWVHIEAYLKKRFDQTGQLTVWQNGVKIINVPNIRTILNEGDRLHWSVNNYTDDITPSTASIYVDDAVISTKRVFSFAY